MRRPRGSTTGRNRLTLLGMTMLLLVLVPSLPTWARLLAGGLGLALVAVAAIMRTPTSEDRVHHAGPHDAPYQDPVFKAHMKNNFGG